METKVIPAYTSRDSEGGLLPSSEMYINKIGLKTSPTILSRYWKGIEGNHSPCVIEIKKL